MFEKLQAGEKIHDAPRQPNTRLELSFDKIPDCALRKWPHQHHVCSHTLPFIAIFDRVHVLLLIHNYSNQCPGATV